MLCEKNNKHQHHHHYYDDYDDDCSYCLCCLEPQELTTRFHYSVSSNCLVLRTAWAPKWTSQDLFGPSCFGFKLTPNPLAQLTCVGSKALANIDKLPPKSRITHAPRGIVLQTQLGWGTADQALAPTQSPESPHQNQRPQSLRGSQKKHMTCQYLMFHLT